MPIGYDKCPASFNSLVQKVINKHHPELKEAEVTIDCLFAHGSEDGSSVKLHGYPCAAKIRRTNLKERVKGHADAEIIFDQGQWEDLSEEGRVALIDHELQHLEVARDKKTGAMKSDDHGRPKLLMRLHDAQIGIFKVIIERHGAEAIDTQVARKFMDEYKQLLMWAEDQTAVA